MLLAKHKGLNPTHVADSRYAGKRPLIQYSTSETDIRDFEQDWRNEQLSQRSLRIPIPQIPNMSSDTYQEIQASPRIFTTSAPAMPVFSIT